MKPSTSYTYKIVVTNAGGSCTSSSYTIMTGALPSSAPKVTPTISNASAHDKGFIVTSTGLSGNTTSSSMPTAPSSGPPPGRRCPAART